MYGVHMIRFSWNRAKHTSNMQKHNVSFEEERSVFFDEFAVQFFDLDNSVSEDRYLMLGMSDRGRLLIVVHCVSDSENMIRIISARKATANESLFYKGAEK